MEIPPFIPGAFDRNVEMLRGALGFEKAKEVGRDVRTFEFLIDGESQGVVEVGEGKYKSALLLLLLVRRAGTLHFPILEEDRAIVRDYFSKEDIAKAMETEGEEHPTVYWLLIDATVSVKIN